MDRDEQCRQLQLPVLHHQVEQRVRFRVIGDPDVLQEKKKGVVNYKDLLYESHYLNICFCQIWSIRVWICPCLKDLFETLWTLNGISLFRLAFLFYSCVSYLLNFLSFSCIPLLCTFVFHLCPTILAPLVQLVSVLPSPLCQSGCPLSSHLVSCFVLALFLKFFVFGYQSSS